MLDYTETQRHGYFGLQCPELLNKVSLTVFNVVHVFVTHVCMKDCIRYVAIDKVYMYLCCYV